MNSLYPWEERVVTVVLIYILNQFPNESEINECDSIETQEIKKLKWFDWNPQQKLLKKILPSLLKKTTRIGFMERRRSGGWEKPRHLRVLDLGRILRFRFLG